MDLTTKAKLFSKTIKYLAKFRDNVIKSLEVYTLEVDSQLSFSVNLDVKIMLKKLSESLKKDHLEQNIDSILRTLKPDGGSGYAVEFDRYCENFFEMFFENSDGFCRETYRGLMEKGMLCRKFLKPDSELNNKSLLDVLEIYAVFIRNEKLGSDCNSILLEPEACESKGESKLMPKTAVGADQFCTDLNDCESLSSCKNIRQPSSVSVPKAEGSQPARINSTLVISRNSGTQVSVAIASFMLFLGILSRNMFPFREKSRIVNTTVDGPQAFESSDQIFDKLSTWLFRNDIQVILLLRFVCFQYWYKFLTDEFTLRTSSCIIWDPGGTH